MTSEFINVLISFSGLILNSHFNVKLNVRCSGLIVSHNFLADFAFLLNLLQSGLSFLPISLYNKLN